MKVMNKCFLLIIVFLVGCSTTPTIKYIDAASSDTCQSLQAYLDTNNIDKEEYLFAPFKHKERMEKTLDDDALLTSFDKVYFRFCKNGNKYLVEKGTVSESIYKLYDEHDRHLSSFNQSTLNSLKTGIAKSEDKWRGENKFLQNITLTKPIVKSFVIRYPETKGMIKSKAKNLRKEFLQQSVLDSLMQIYKLPLESREISTFLDLNFPGQFLRTPFKQITSKVNSYVGKYFITWSNLQESKFKDVYDMGEIDYYYYSPGSERGNISDKESNLKLLLDDKNTREQIMGAILIAESNLKVKRINQKEVEISYNINLPKILKTYPFKKISDFAYKQKTVELDYDNTPEVKKLLSPNIITGKISATFKWPYVDIKATTSAEAKREKLKARLLEVSEAYSTLFRLPEHNIAIKEFLTKKFFGPFSSFKDMEQHRKALKKSLYANGLLQSWEYKEGTGKLVDSYVLKLDSLDFDKDFIDLTKFMNFRNSNVEYDKANYEYWDGSSPSRKKNEALENILSEESVKMEALGFLLASYSKVELIEESEDYFTVKISIDFSDLIKRSKPKLITDYIEQ